MTRRFLLYCGVAASLLYITLNIVTPFFYEGYNWVTQTVSELSAIDAPTRPLWIVPGLLYALLIAAFGLGVVKSATGNRALRIVGILLIAHGLIGLAWSPMHQREVLAAGGGTFTDIWHIVMSMITLLFVILMVSIGAFSLGKSFRIFSFSTLVVFVVFGILTGSEAPDVNKNLATPFIGLWERINIAAYLVWLIVLAAVLLTTERRAALVLSRKNIEQQRRVLTKKHSQIHKPVH